MVFQTWHFIVVALAGWLNQYTHAATAHEERNVL